LDSEQKLTFIRQKARENAVDPDGAKVLWSRHAIARLVRERINRRQVEKALEAVESVEDYSTLTRALPDCLVLGWLSYDEPIHAVVACDERLDRIFVVTVYRPSEERWEDDRRTRK